MILEKDGALLSLNFFQQGVLAQMFRFATLRRAPWVFKVESLGRFAFIYHIETPLTISSSFIFIVISSGWVLPRC
jgi:hypothetical protein